MLIASIFNVTNWTHDNKIIIFTLLPNYYREDSNWIKINKIVINCPKQKEEQMLEESIDGL